MASWHSAEQCQDQHNSNYPRKEFRCGVRHEICIQIGWRYWLALQVFIAGVNLSIGLHWTAWELTSCPLPIVTWHGTVRLERCRGVVPESVTRDAGPRARPGRLRTGPPGQHQPTPIRSTMLPYASATGEHRTGDDAVHLPRAPPSEADVSPQAVTRSRRSVVASAERHPGGPDCEWSRSAARTKRAGSAPCCSCMHIGSAGSFVSPRGACPLLPPQHCMLEFHSDNAWF